MKNLPVAPGQIRPAQIQPTAQPITCLSSKQAFPAAFAYLLLSSLPLVAVMPLATSAMAQTRDRFDVAYLLDETGNRLVGTWYTPFGPIEMRAGGSRTTPQVGGNVKDAQGRSYNIFYRPGGQMFFQVINGINNFAAPFVIASDGQSFVVDGSGQGVNGRWRATRWNPYQASSLATAEQATLLRVLEGRWQERGGGNMWRFPIAGQEGLTNARTWSSTGTEAAGSNADFSPSEGGSALVGTLSNGDQVLIERDGNGRFFLSRPAMNGAPAQSTQLVRVTGSAAGQQELPVYDTRSPAVPAPAGQTPSAGGLSPAQMTAVQLQGTFAPWLRQWKHIDGSDLTIKLEGSRIFGQTAEGIFHVDLAKSTASRLVGPFRRHGAIGSDNELELNLLASGQTIHGFYFEGGGIGMPHIYRAQTSTQRPHSALLQQIEGIWTTPAGQLELVRSTREGKLIGTHSAAGGQPSHDLSVALSETDPSSPRQSWIFRSGSTEIPAYALLDAEHDVLLVGAAYASRTTTLPGNAITWTLRRFGTATPPANYTPPAGPQPSLPVGTPPDGSAGPVIVGTSPQNSQGPLQAPPASAGTFKPLNRIDVRLDRVIVPRGYPTYQVHAFLTIKNVSPTPQYFTSGFMKVFLTDADGVSLERSQPYRASGEPAELFGATPVIQPGGELKVRYIFLPEMDAQLTSLSMSEGDKRAEFAVSGL